MAIKVGRWDCTQCGFKGNLGPKKRCEKCGAPRPENVTFYLSEDSKIVDNADKLKEAKSGADWVCSFCSGHNKATEIICQSCGNNRDATDGDESLKEKLHLYNQKPKTEKTSFKLGKGLKRVLIGLISFIVLFAILAQFTSEINVTVTGFKWERSIEIEENRKVIEENWNIPKGGEGISSFRDIHHYDQLEDGTETRTRTVQKQVGTEKVKIGVKDLGNGYFEDIYEERPVYEDVEETYEATKYKRIPVYKTKYKYAVFRWKEAGKLNAEDNKKPAYWPVDDRLDDENKFRIKKRNEKYFMIIIDEDKENFTEEVKFELWDKTKLDDVIIAEKSSIFGTFLGLKPSMRD
ncbi:MAG: hypothetical protein DRI95_07630 [Bacteroidetes bacterium]|nr:MAG: hypothetical protein DRI95_07630 [Bacteroidota bacterium]